jgi:hypothetical protein
MLQAKLVILCVKKWLYSLVCMESDQLKVLAAIVILLNLVFISRITFASWETSLGLHALHSVLNF